MLDKISTDQQRDPTNYSFSSYFISYLCSSNLC